MELVDAANEVSQVQIDLGTGLARSDVDYRPNADVVVSIASALAGGKKVRSIRYCSRMILAN
jgi:hypothetical protein